MAHRICRSVNVDFAATGQQLTVHTEFINGPKSANQPASRISGKEKRVPGVRQSELMIYRAVTVYLVPEEPWMSAPPD
jgi:hypothetical protein